MEYLFLVSDAAQAAHYQTALHRLQPKMTEFIALLKTQYGLAELPRAVVLTDQETATQTISNIPLPAYTNDFRTVFCPDVDVWRALYLRQLSEGELPELQQYYHNSLSWNHVMQILGHEFVHHIDLFFDDAYEKGIWFEEGMCEYISRRYFLTDSEFSMECWANTVLVQHFEQKHGTTSLTDFGSETYQQDHAAIFHGYWKSFLAVNALVEQYHGDVDLVFQEYQRWHSSGTSDTLAQWFQLE